MRSIAFKASFSIFNPQNLKQKAMPESRPQPSATISFRMYVLVVIAVRKNPVTWDADFLEGLPGRFLSPDNYIQAPDNPQNYNRYSYVLNNPMRYTDPSGYSVQPHPDDENWNYSPAHHDINSNLSMQGVDWRSNLWGKDQHFWYLSLSDFQEQYGELSYTNYLYANGYLGGTNSARNIFIQLRDAINAGFNISIVYAFGRNTIVSSIGDLGGSYFGQNGAIGFDNPTASAFLQEANVGASSQGGGNIFDDPRLNGIKDIAGETSSTINGATGLAKWQLISDYKNGGDVMGIMKANKQLSKFGAPAKILGKAVGVVSIAEHSYKAYDAYQQGDWDSFAINSGKLVLDGVFTFVKVSNPLFWGGAIIYGAVDYATNDY